MQTRIKKVTTIDGNIKYTPQYKPNWYSSWKGFYFYENNVNGVAVLSNEAIHPVRYDGEETRNIDNAKQVIDIFLKNPVVKEKIEYIKYP